MKKRIEDKVKDDRMSDHATFTGQDPAVPAVEAESMKNEFKVTERSRAEAKEALASLRDLEAEEHPAMHETTFFDGESVRIDGGSRAAKLECGSRQAFVVVSIRTVTFRMLMRWCAYSMRNSMEMTARIRVASRVSTRSAPRKFWSD